MDLGTRICDLNLRSKEMKKRKMNSLWTGSQVGYRRKENFASRASEARYGGRSYKFMRFRFRWISPMNNFIYHYYWYSDSIERNDWHKITLLTYYLQANYKGAERRHQKNVHRFPPFPPTSSSSSPSSVGFFLMKCFIHLLSWARQQIYTSAPQQDSAS